ncbi:MULTISPECIES: hypothetical protein [unclassified Streptomyces]|uniref:hypothetical protein n=1 Tax=unclassified Streptomyces TaxID=2593676 RepID=UPI002E2D3CEE|nr:hypothetical protein [Streptomyces sp. NBC_01439]
MSSERAQGRGWVRIPASRGEQPAGRSRATGYDHVGYDHVGYDHVGYDHAGYDRGGYDRAGYDHAAYEGPYAAPYAGPYATASHADQPTIYLSVVKRWREAGRTLPGHPDEEWERLISQPYWPGR